MKTLLRLAFVAFLVLPLWAPGCSQPATSTPENIVEAPEDPGETAEAPEAPMDGPADEGGDGEPDE